MKSNFQLNVSGTVVHVMFYNQDISQSMVVVNSCEFLRKFIHFNDIMIHPKNAYDVI